MSGYEHIEGYVHDNRIGVLVHFCAESSYTLRTDEFKTLAHDLALHIAASSPAALDAKSLDQRIRNEELNRNKAALESLSEEDKLDEIERRNRQINEEYCLMEQGFVKDPTVRIHELVATYAEKLQDKLKIKRFVRWEADET